MGLTARLMEQRSLLTTLKDPAKWLIDLWGGAMSAAGVTVTPASTRRVVAVWAAIKLISEDFASLPVFIYKRRKEGQGRDKQLQNPLHRILHDQPNPWQTSFEWREMMQGHALLRGNSYSEILYDGRGGIRSLIPRHPDRMRVFDITEAGIGEQPLVYEYQPPTGPPRFLFMDDVLHIKGFSDDGLMGLNPVSECRDALGLAIGVDKYASKYFANYANPGGVLSHPKSLSPEARKRLKDAWDEKQTGVDNAHKVAVLEEGLTWTAIGVKPQDSQLLESRKYSVTDVARMFRIPPHKLGDLERATFTNIEQQAIAYVVDTLRPWLVRWEQRLALALLTPKERADGLYIEFLVDGLLRGDIASRYKAYSVARQWGWMSANDIRDLENMNPRADAGGDAYHEPLNMQSSDDPAEDKDEKTEGVPA